MPLRIQLKREEVNTQFSFSQLYKLLGTSVSAYLCFTREQIFVLCDKQDKGDYRVYACVNDGEKEEDFFDIHGKCLLLPEYTFFITPIKEIAVRSFIEVAAQGFMLEERKEQKPIPNPLNFGVHRQEWILDEINKNKRPDETVDDFVERAVLEHCQQRKTNAH